MDTPSSITRVALMQYPICWAEVHENLRLTESRLQEVEGKADVVLLPEMFTTGFCTDRPDLAETTEGVTVASLRRWAQRYKLAIAGSFICRDEGKLYNRGFFATPDGEVAFVDKRHLYASGGESRFFAPGQERKVFVYQGVRFCLQICYDLRFPVWQRNASGYDYDILLYVAAWPEVRIGAWDVLLRARAIENQCYLAAVNTVGDDGLGLHYNGHSIALDTHLQTIASLPDNESGTVIAHFDMDMLRHFREVLPLWKDADKFQIQ